MKTRILCFFALFLFAGGSLLNAQLATLGTHYGSPGGIPGANLVSINSTTGATTSIASLFTPSTIAMAVDPTTSQLYSINSQGSGSAWTLDIVNVSTGGFTNIAAYNTNPGANDQFHGIEFDGAGNLFAATRTSGEIYSIDKLTGVPTLVVAATNINFSGMARQPNSNTIYLSDISGNLYTFDPGTGQLSGTSVSTGVASVADLFFDLSGNLYLTQGQSAFPPTLYSVNPGTGAATAIGPTGVPIAGATTALPPFAAQVPTLSEWGLILLALVVLAGGTIAVWRKQQSTATA